MMILGINGSPRKQGNTEVLLDKALEGAASAGAAVKKITLAGLKYSGCLECDYDSDYASCRRDDGMDGVFESIREADALILASPVFFGSLTGQTKCMIDRFQCVWRTKYVLKNAPAAAKKTGAFICVEASHKEAYFLNAKSIVTIFFNVIDVAYAEELLCQGLDEKGSVLKKPVCLEKAFELGKRIAGAS